MIGTSVIVLLVHALPGLRTTELRVETSEQQDCRVSAMKYTKCGSVLNGCHKIHYFHLSLCVFLPLHNTEEWNSSCDFLMLWLLEKYAAHKLSGAVWTLKEKKSQNKEHICCQYEQKWADRSLRHTSCFTFKTELVLRCHSTWHRVGSFASHYIHVC